MNLGGKILRTLIIYGPPIILLIQAIIISVEFAQGKTNSIILTWTLVTMIPVYIFFLITKNHDDNVTHSKFQNELEKLRSDIENSNNASIEVFKNRIDFYDKIGEERLKAQSIVQLTLLDSYSPYKNEENKARRDYFDNDIKNIKELNSRCVKFYRILSIETEEKWKWVKRLIEETEDLDNVFLAYIKVGDIEKSVPFPKLLSLQIIDNEKVFMLNPKFSYMPNDYESCYYMKNKEVAEIYVDYYKNVWASLKNSEHGCIIKSGKDNYEDKMNEILKYIKGKTK